MEREYWYVTTAAILSGALVFGSRAFAEMGISLYQLSVFSLVFIVVFLPLVVFKKEYRIRKGMLKLFAVLGFVAAMACFTEFGPVFLGVPVAIVVLLLYTQPLWTTVMGRVFLHEEITIWKLAAIVLVIGGVASIVNPFNASSLGSIFGVMLALAGGVLLSVWLILARVAGLRKYNPVTTKLGDSIFMIMYLLLLYPFLSLFIKDPSIMDISPNMPPVMWFYLGLFSIFIIILPNILYFRSARKVPASVGGIILLLEPLVAAVLAAVFLGQPITVNIVVGGALILASNYIVIRKSSKEVITLE